MRITLIAVALLATVSTQAHAALSVFACEPEWGALATELGGGKIDLYVATTGKQDPHQIQARPSLIAKARAADLAICTGAELEIGWMPMIQKQSANGKIQPGAAGYMEATKFAHLLEVPTRLDRADGDVHAAGNPHIQTDPRNILAVAKPLSQRMAELDPANASIYAQRLDDFSARMTKAIAGWQAQAAPLKGVPVAVQHKDWVYLFTWLGLNEVVSLEPKPGVPASSGYLAQVLETVQRTPMKMVIHGAYEDARPSDFLSQRAKIPEVELPFTVGGDDAAKDLFGLYDDTVQRLLKGLGQ